MIKGLWWKLASVVILIYVIVFGIAVPLRPGIMSVQPGRAVAGAEVTLAIDGYNTAFEDGQDIHAWLKLNDSFALISSRIEIGNRTHIKAQFSIPEEFPLHGTVHPMTLIVHDAHDGSFVLPRAVFVRECRFSPTPSGAWHNAREMVSDEARAFAYPYRSILHETIRNVYFHVPMWFGMIILFFASAWCSIRYIRHNHPEDDFKALALTGTGIVFGIMGLLTGMIWSRYTWGQFWSWDVKQNTAAIAVLIYLAYFVLRNTIPDVDRKARVAAVYNVFGCAMLIPLLFVIPRLTVSLHPGNGGNPALGEEDLDNTMRLVFYPAVIGWTLLGVWISELRLRMLRLRWKALFEK